MTVRLAGHEIIGLVQHFECIELDLYTIGFVFIGRTDHCAEFWRSLLDPDQRESVPAS